MKRQLFPFCQHTSALPRNGGPSYFLVTSWGHNGSIWLAGSLNLHDAVCATAGIDNPIECFSYYPLNKNAAYVVEHADVELGRYGFTNPDRPEFATYRAAMTAGGAAIPPRDPSRLPSYLFDELDLVPTATPYDVLGNVHGVTLGQMHEAFIAEPGVLKGRPVLTVDLIRHPVGRTESAINATLKYHLTDLEPAIAAFIHDHAQECLELERQYTVDFTEPRTRAALHVYRQGLQNDVWANEVRMFPDAHRILLERLQTDPEYYACVFVTLTQGRLVADTAYLNRVFAPQNQGSGRRTTSEHARPLRPAEQYDLWSPWERDQFAKVAQRLELPRLYFPFGYDFSFVARSAVGGSSWFAEMMSSQAS